MAGRGTNKGIHAGKTKMLLKQLTQIEYNEQTIRRSLGITGKHASNPKTVISNL